MGRLPPTRPGMWMRLTLPLLTIPRSLPAFDLDGRGLSLRIPYERKQLPGQRWSSDLNERIALALQSLFDFADCAANDRTVPVGTRAQER